MSKIGLKIEPETYERLKWLKTRFDFVYETNMTWDELFQAIVKDSLLILAQFLHLVQTQISSSFSKCNCYLWLLPLSKI